MISQVAMAEDFQVCSGNWWNSPRNFFGSSPCSWAVNDLGWPSNCDGPVMDVNNTAISSDDSAGSASDGSCTSLPDAPKTQPPISNGSMSTDCWNQDFLHESGRSEENYSQIMDYRQENWINPKNFFEDLSSNPFKQVNQDFSIQHQPLNSNANSIESCATTCEEIQINFPMNPSSYSYASSLMQNLLGQDNSQPHVLSFLDDEKIMNYLSEANYGMNPNELLLSSLPKSSSMVIQPSRPQQPANHFPFSNNNTVRFLNATASALRNDSSNFIPSTNSSIVPSIHSSITNTIPINISAANNHEGTRDVTSLAKKQNSSRPAFKRPRIETPSPLPTFKVRKEKLGDRITALQQLVSPFGKTDTASVLHEAIEYIKFLHDQVKVLSTPYLKNGSPPVLQHQQAAGNKPKDREWLKQDLKGRGLCLVPISSSFPVAAETTSDFWTQTFGVSFR